MKTYATMEDFKMKYAFLTDNRTLILEISHIHQSLSIYDTAVVMDGCEDSKNECIESFKDFIKELPDELKDIARDVLFYPISKLETEDQYNEAQERLGLLTSEHVREGSCKERECEMLLYLIEDYQRRNIKEV